MADLTSIWIAAPACAYIADAYPDLDIRWQMPSGAKTKATNERLRLWGLWETGSEHKRDVMRHIALRMDGLVC